MEEHLNQFLPLLTVKVFFKATINALSPEIKMPILLTVLHTFPTELVRRICLNIKTSSFFILIT